MNFIDNSLFNAGSFILFLQEVQIRYAKGYDCFPLADMSVKQLSIFPLLSAVIPVATNLLCIKNIAIAIAISNWQVLPLFFCKSGKFYTLFYGGR